MFSCLYIIVILGVGGMDIEQVAFSQRELVFPYIYGSLAFSLGKKGESYTHRWICYVRGVNGEDLSYLIKKVVFVLHSSFQNPIKQIHQPPYEIQEVGWGEFQILIQIHFNHPTMPHVQVPHLLKLHHIHTSSSQQIKKPLCSQTYDQIVFTQMDEHLQRIIRDKANHQNSVMAVENHAEEDGVVQPDLPLKSITQYSQYYTAMDGVDHKNRFDDALRFIKGQISSLEEKMRIAELDIQKVYEQIYNQTT